MPRAISWMYHRNGCTGCQKAQTFLEGVPHSVGEKVIANKVRIGRDDALTLAKAARRVVTGRGKNPVTFDMQKSPPDDDTLAAAILGPTGNLKAPTLRVGSTLLVGYNKAAYQHVFGTA